ncbi:hypothetical protein JHK87_028161 [Glycine soja]|nr:hypothetical protein JHK87_028161 [Glycine soja]
MARASSGLQYPERFYAAASYVGFDGFTSPSNFITSKFSNSTALLYNLYQQEEENPGRYSRASNSAVDPVVDVLMNHNSKVDPIIENGNTYPEIKTISTENGSQVRTQDKDVVIESFGSIGVYDQWITPPVPGQRPKARFEIPWENKLLSIVGHTKDPNESIQGVSETVVVTSVQGRVPIASEVYVLKSSHISTLQSKLIENSILNSVYGVHNATNATRNLESETGHKWIKELAVDNVDSIAEKEELKSSLHKDKLQTLQLKQELSEAETRNSDLCKEEVVELSQKLQTIGTLQKELELLQRQKNASEQAALNAKQKQGSGGVWGSSDRVIELTG